MNSNTSTDPAVVLSEGDLRTLQQIIDQYNASTQGRRSNGFFDPLFTASAAYLVKGSLPAATVDEDTGFLTPSFAELPVYKLIEYGEDEEVGLVRVTGATHVCYNVFEYEIEEGFHIASRDQFGKYLVHAFASCEGVDVDEACDSGFREPLENGLCPDGSRPYTFETTSADCTDCGSGSGSGSGAADADCVFVCIDDEMVGDAGPGCAGTGGGAWNPYGDAVDLSGVFDDGDCSCSALETAELELQDEALSGAYEWRASIVLCSQTCQLILNRGIGWESLLLTGTSPSISIQWTGDGNGDLTRDADPDDSTECDWPDSITLT